MLYTQDLYVLMHCDTFKWTEINCTEQSSAQMKCTALKGNVGASKQNTSKQSLASAGRIGRGCNVFELTS